MCCRLCPQVLLSSAMAQALPPISVEHIFLQLGTKATAQVRVLMGDGVGGLFQRQTPAGWAAYAELQVQKGLCLKAGLRRNSRRHLIENTHKFLTHRILH